MSPNRSFFKSHKAPKAIRLNELCPVCGEHAQLVQDHCHSTGLKRDRICTRCNVLLGRIETKPKQAQRLAAYIERWQLEHERGGARYGT